MPTINKDIAQQAQDNTDFRRVILTNKHSQVVLMSVEPGDDIGEETHEVDQILYFVDGEGDAVLNSQTSRIHPGSLVSVPAGALHNFVNTGDRPLKLYTIYAPPEEEPNTVHKTKAEAEEAEKQAGH
ncbi:MAG: cupin domain-containing protein [Proteobacteria bacterium]|nr:cupin domain-containing protein [Pseudomonadota bacterium]